MRKLVIVLFAITIWGSCTKESLDDCFSSTGKDKTIERPLKSFHKIHIGDKFKVTLVQDTGAEKIHITAGEHLLEGISAEVENGELIVKNKNHCNFVRKYNREMKLTIFVRKIDYLNIYAATSVRSDDTLHLDSLEIYHQALEDMDLTLDVKNKIYIESINSGGMTLHGKAGTFTCSIEEITDVDARDFVCREVLMDTHTPLDCFVNATDLLFVKIYNSGNIFYVNEPTGRKEVNVNTGTGKLMKLSQ